MEFLHGAIILGQGDETGPVSFQTENGLKVVAACDEGYGRAKGNEDRVVLSPNVFAVIDGMGGLKNGEQAAAMVASCIEENTDDVRKGLADADSLLKEYLRGSGAAVTALDVGPKSAEAHVVGDTKWIIHRQRTMFQRLLGHRMIPAFMRASPDIEESKGHGVAQMLADKKIIRQDEVDGHRFAHTLNRYIGGNVSNPESRVLSFRPGDRLFLATDGLYGTVSVPELIALSNRLSLEDLMTEVWGLSDAYMRGTKERPDGKKPKWDNRSFIGIERITQ